MIATEENVLSLPLDAAQISTSEKYSDVIFPPRDQRKLAWHDVKEGALMWRVWAMLAYQDIKLRYRRSVLGPFWLTLSMAITVYSMGFLYARLFHIELNQYYPYLVTGMLAWSLISTVLNEITDGLVASEPFIKQMKLPYSLYIHRIAYRNILIFFHNIFVLIPIIIIFHESIKVNWHTLLLIPGLAIIYFNTLTYGLLVSMVGARYRDISQVIKSLIQVIFFITPVMWQVDLLGAKGHLIVNLNPFYGFLECLRQPLLGKMPTSTNLLSVTLVTLVGIALSAKIFIRYRSRIVYWL